MDPPSPQTEPLTVADDDISLEEDDISQDKKSAKEVTVDETAIAAAMSKSQKEKKRRKRRVKVENLASKMRQLQKEQIYRPLPRQWWEKPVVEFAFSHPRVRGRLEKLMGANVVRITDRRYMQRLKEKIQEDHLTSLGLRIKQREIEEIEREKRLILEGKLGVEFAPKELADHPVFKISQLTKKLVEVKKAKQRFPPLTISYYADPEMAAEEDKAVGEGEAAQVAGLSAGAMPSVDVPGGYPDDLDKIPRDHVDLEIDIERGYMFTQEEFERLKYESPLVRQLRTLTTVEEMYRLADEIVGPLKIYKKK